MTNTESFDRVAPHPLAKGWHRPLKHERIFIDGCVQIWPDADFPNLRDCGTNAYVITTFRPHDDHGNALTAVADWWRIARSYPDAIRIAQSVADIRAAKAAGQVAIVIGCQGGDFLGQNLDLLDMFHRLGLRVMIPAYNARTALADGLLEPTNAGLSRMGRRWVERCNTLGIVIDLTHVGERSSLDALELTAQPVVFSHSNPRKLVDSPRNITDAQIKGCAATGGVVGVTNWGPLNLPAGQTTRPTLDQWLDGIAYVADLVGIDHVGMATDMSHGTYPDGDLIRGRSAGQADPYGKHIEANPRSKRRHVEGFDDFGQLEEVAAAMARRGFSDEDVAKLMGGNLMRVYAAVWGG